MAKWFAIKFNHSTSFGLIFETVYTSQDSTQLHLMPIFRPSGRRLVSLPSGRGVHRRAGRPHGGSAAKSAAQPDRNMGNRQGVHFPTTPWHCHVCLFTLTPQTTPSSLMGSKILISYKRCMEEGRAVFF